MLVLWAIDQPSHDMIIGNNFQTLPCACKRTLSQIIFKINSHSVPIVKLNVVSTH